MMSTDDLWVVFKVVSILHDIGLCSGDVLVDIDGLYVDALKRET